MPCWQASGSGSPGDLATAWAVAAELARRGAVSVPDGARHGDVQRGRAQIHNWLRREAAAARAGGDRAGLIRVGAYLGALVFYAVSLEFLGFIVATALTITFILRIAEGYGWLA